MPKTLFLWSRVFLFSQEIFGLRGRRRKPVEEGAVVESAGRVEDRRKITKETNKEGQGWKTTKKKVQKWKMPRCKKE